MNKICVLVAGSANVTGMNIIRALVAENINVVGCDFKIINPANKFCNNEVVPLCSDIKYFSSILDIIKRYRITHIIASNDHDVRALMNNNDELVEFNVKFNGASIHTLDFLDKNLTTELFAEKEILTPSILIDDTDYPYVLRKSTMGSNEKFVHIIKNNNDRGSIDKSDFECGIITRFIEGQEYTIDVLCNEDSEVISIIPRLRIEVNNGMVHHAQITKNIEIINLVTQMCKNLKLKGMNCIQCIENSGKYYFIEINPRPGSGIDLSINAGANMPLFWVTNRLNEFIDPNWNLKMVRYLDGYFFE